jgi:hypothetical protein
MSNDEKVRSSGDSSVREAPTPVLPAPAVQKTEPAALHPAVYVMYVELVWLVCQNALTGEIVHGSL